tara:strand:+ start:348 stop:1070 length:723 start_codon:yes stop_codon:yes gene_type:complete
MNKLITILVILFLTACSSLETQNPYLLIYPNIEDKDGVVVFENEYVVLQKLIVGPGEWEGVHSHPGNQLYVHIKGGEWSGMLDGEIEYSAEISENGSVGWMDAIPLSASHNSGNTGDEAIELIYVTLKKDKPLYPNEERSSHVYPNLAQELLFENDRLIAQRVQIEPGQWEGVHSHPGGQLYIVIKAGETSAKLGGKIQYSGQIGNDGAAGWMDAIELDAGHESGNTGDTLIDLVWITLK